MRERKSKGRGRRERVFRVSTQVLITYVLFREIDRESLYLLKALRHHPGILATEQSLLSTDLSRL